MGRVLLEVLNRESVTITDDTSTPNDDVDIATGVPVLEEVTQVIQQLKSRKAHGTANIDTEMLKTNIKFAGRVFTDLLRDIWTNDVIPNDWNKGLIAKLPKKGDHQHCNKWRGITPVPSKIFCRVLLNRIEGDINIKLCQEQAGFRRIKGCTDKKIALRNIFEWNAPLCNGFIYF